MAWEWVAPLATGAVGAVGVIANVVTVKFTTSATRAVAKYSARAQLEVARDAKRTETLRESIEYTNSVAHLLDRIARRLATNEEIAESTKLYSQVLAGVAIHFDDPSRDAFIAWNEAVKGLMKVASEKGQCQELETGLDRMTAKQGEFMAAANRLANQTPHGLK